ncbi:MAG: hypothetical protein M1830_007999 [Pleopsidium flavum]|nr:MAG: hypothetical protein M1830_007999 [Pleopsidium flavum]
MPRRNTTPTLPHQLCAQTASLLLGHSRLTSRLVPPVHANGRSTYPQNRQRNLRNPKPPLNLPLRIFALPGRKQQLPQKRQRASQPPPCRRQRTQRATDQKGNVPAPGNAEKDGNAGM